MDAARAIFNDHLADPSVARGVVVVGALAVASVVIAARTFSRTAA